MAREKYGYAETSDLRATLAGHIHSVVKDDLALENGMLMKLGKLKKADEIYEVTLPAAGDKIVMIHSALYAYDTSTTLGQHEMYLRKEAGEAARAYDIEPLDRYAVADYMVTALANNKVVEGNLVVVDPATGKYKELAANGDVSKAGFVAEIEKIVHKTNLTLLHLRVLKNEDVA